MEALIKFWQNTARPCVLHLISGVLCLSGLLQCSPQLEPQDQASTLSSILLACHLSGTGCYNTVTLDTDFNGNGVATLNNPAANGDDAAFSLDIDSSNRIVLGGSSTTVSSDIDSLIVRLLDNGSLDSSFNGGGASTQDTSGAAKPDYVRDIKIDSSGKISMTGQTVPTTNRDLFAARLNSDGSFDTSFNATGLRRIHNLAGGAERDVGAALAFDSSNRLVLAGYSATTSTPLDLDHIVIRLLSNGNTDTGFGTSGVTKIPNAPLRDTTAGSSMAIDSNGRILYAAQRNNGTNDASGANYDLIVYRLRTDGTADTSFNGTGFHVVHGTAGGNLHEIPYDLLVDANDNVYVAGASYNGSNYNGVIWSFQSDGSINATFGTNGAIVFPDSGTDEVMRALTLDKQNRIVSCGGLVTSSGTTDLIVRRTTTAGILDQTFAGGKFRHNSAAGGNGNDICNDMHFNQNDRLVVAGSSYNGSNADLAVWRLIIQ